MRLLKRPTYDERIDEVGDTYKWRGWLLWRRPRDGEERITVVTET